MKHTFLLDENIPYLAIRGVDARDNPDLAATRLVFLIAKNCHKTVADEFLIRVAPTFVLKYNIRTRSLADPGAIEDVLAVENDVVPFDRADVLEQGCVNAFLGDSLRSPRPRDLLGLPTGFETERSWPRCL